MRCMYGHCAHDMMPLDYSLEVTHKVETDVDKGLLSGISVSDSKEQQ